MRILMLAQSFSPVVGGEERIVEDLSAELASRGHEVGIATLRQPAGDPPSRNDGVEVHLLEGSVRRLPGVSADEERNYAPPGPDPLTVRDLRRVIHKRRPQVVHGHNWLAHSYLPLAAHSAARAAFVLSLHDYSLLCATKRLFYKGRVCPGPTMRRCLAHSVEQYGAAKGAVTAVGTRLGDTWMRRRVDMFLPVSEAVRDLSGVAGERHRVVPNFIGELPPSPPGADRRLETLPDEPFVLYFGDLTEDKGVDLLVDAYRELDEPPPLVLVGRNLIDLPASPGIRPLGQLPHPLAIETLRRSLFSVAPSLLPESFGIVALESAAAGRPAIVSNIGGLADVVVHGETGLLFPAGDKAALLVALRRLLDDSNLVARMGEAARARAAEFGADRVVPRFEEAYRAALTARGERQPER